MIKLELSDKPKKLTEKVQKRLTKEFINSGKKKVVWKYKYIYEEVRKIAFGKCSFSEINLDTKSTYTEIEHFFPKDLYPNKVVEWGNLLPSSKKCNTTKGDTDTVKDKIVNPLIDNPKEHLYFENFRLYPKDSSNIGRNTILTVALNDRLHFVNPRSEQSLMVLDFMDAFYEDYIETDELKKLNGIKLSNRINRIKGILSSINRKTEFSACIATAVIDSPNYIEIISYLKNNDFWDIEFQSYEEELSFCYLGKQ
ncbi:hypothetical protein [Winogradskyella sp.]|uniref:hypothetical protein n=1 Tax=Winogradskyella sp. TaxID=1883156 RepID=UPI00262659EA|nr:hypothetical protein [Winogradskyella sp.]